MDPAEKNKPMIEKKNFKKEVFFSSSSGASMVQGEKRAPSAINATDGSLHTMSLQVSNKVDPWKPGAAAQLLQQQPGVMEP